MIRDEDTSHGVMHCDGLLYEGDNLGGIWVNGKFFSYVGNTTINTNDFFPNNTTSSIPFNANSFFPEDKPEDEHDMVNRPSHYTAGTLEVIDIIEDQLSTEEFIGYLRGNILKYNLRYKLKNGVEDLKKSEYYLKKLIEVESER